MIFFVQIEAPFKPEVGDATDVSNFDTDFTSEDPTLTPPDDSKSLIITHSNNSQCVL